MSNQLIYVFGMHDEKTDYEYEIEVGGAQAEGAPRAAFVKNGNTWEMHIRESDSAKATVLTEEQWKGAGLKIYKASTDCLFTLYDNFALCEDGWDIMLQNMQEDRIELAYKEKRSIRSEN